MRLPESLVSLQDQGVIYEVIRPLMAGKEARLYLVTTATGVAVAKVYKDAQVRSFKQRAAYMEGRKERNSRRQRAMDRGSRYGREAEEEAWRNTEVDALSRLREAGVRVPEPYDFVDGVLIMELVADAEGEAAPRLVDLAFDEAEAEYLHGFLLAQIARMLNAGVVHGDLSDFNILMAHDGPVFIDFPQVVDPAVNRSAKALFVRDVDNLTGFLARFAPRIKDLQFGEEIWELYEHNALDPLMGFSGQVKRPKRSANTDLVLGEIAAAERDAVRRGLIDTAPAQTRRERAREAIYGPNDEPEYAAPRRPREAPRGTADALPYAAPRRSAPPREVPRSRELDELDLLLTVED